MAKKAIIFDLDNTIYPVHSIADKAFTSLYQLIMEYKEQAGQIDKIKADIMRRPFHLTAKDFHFSEELISRGTALLNELEYKGKIEPFEDYAFARNLPLDKFLVTTGFLKLQQSKVTGMKIDGDFKEIHIVDSTTSARTKKDVFADIIERFGYSISEVLVIGDDLHSEIKAAQDLGIDVVLYDKLNLYNEITSVKRIDDFKDLSKIIN
jgi:putative hydrolase of the HAD superfamily